MVSWRRSGRARWRFTAGVLLAVLSGSPALAQVSGEILVGRADNSLAPSTPESALPGELSEPQPVVLPQPVYPRAARAAR